MLPEVKVHSTSSAVNISSGIPIIDNNSKYFQKFMMYQGKDIVASDVSRFRLSNRQYAKVHLAHLRSRHAYEL